MAETETLYSSPKLIFNKPPYFRVWKHKIAGKDKNILVHTCPYSNIPN